MKFTHAAFAFVGLVLALIILHPVHTETASKTLVQLAAQVDALEARVATLETEVATQATDITTLEGTVSAQAAQIGSLQTSAAALADKVQFVSVSGTEMYITGANLNIRNGLGATSEQNGLGNLVIGYNESSIIAEDRTGSHNLVVGPLHTYSSYGGLVAGYQNALTKGYASVTGGRGNTASGYYASVCGGGLNSAAGSGSSVGGGSNNTAFGAFGSVSGGKYVLEYTYGGWSVGGYSTY